MLDTRSWPATSATVTKLDSISVFGTRHHPSPPTRVRQPAVPAKGGGGKRRRGPVRPGRRRVRERSPTDCATRRTGEFVVFAHNRFDGGNDPGPMKAPGSV